MDSVQTSAMRIRVGGEEGETCTGHVISNFRSNEPMPRYSISSK